MLAIWGNQAIQNAQNHTPYIPSSVSATQFTIVLPSCLCLSLLAHLSGVSCCFHVNRCLEQLLQCLDKMASLKAVFRSQAVHKQNCDGTDVVAHIDFPLYLSLATVFYILYVSDKCLSQRFIGGQDFLKFIIIFYL